MRLLLWCAVVPALLLAGMLLVGASAGALGAAGVALLLPAAGLYALVTAAIGEDAAPAGPLAWALLVLVGAPAWVDREAAWTYTLSPPQAARLEALLPALVSSRVPEPAAIAEVDCDCAEAGPPEVVFAPVVMGEGAEGGDLVVLPYEGSVSSMRLPILLEQDRDETETELVFDTGATLTAISPEVIAALGYRIPRDAPRVTMQTANGLRESPLFVVDRLWLGGFPVEGVTAILCDQCGSLNGLLGLNVSSQFRVEVDQSERELLLRPLDVPSRHLDVRPWLDLSLERTGRELRVIAESRAPRPITALEISARCGAAPEERVLLPDLPAGGTAAGLLEAAPGCGSFSLQVEHALW